MALYIVAESGDLSSLIEVLKRSQVEFLFGERIGKVLKAYDQQPVFVATVSEADMLLLNRYPDALLDELPTSLMSVPNMVYSGDWVTLASALPAMDWMEMESKLAKSGATAQTVEQLGERSKTQEYQEYGFSADASPPPSDTPDGHAKDDDDFSDEQV